MTTNTQKPINRIANYFENNGTSTESAAHEDYVGKIVLVEPPIGTFEAGEYIIVDQTANALYGVKLGSPSSRYPRYVHTLARRARSSKNTA